MLVSISNFKSIPIYSADCNAPLIFCIKFIDKLATVLDFSSWIMMSKVDGWKLHRAQNYRHAYSEWPTDIRFKETALRRVHRYFNHPEANWLFAVMKRGTPDKVITQDLELLEKTTSSCKVCQRHTHVPDRIGVSLPNTDCIFNRLFWLDPMTVEKGCVLYMIDVDTKFGSDAFTRGK